MRTALHRGGRIDLLVVLLLGALATISLYAAPHAVALRATFGLPFLVLGPGYALTCALYARDDTPEPAMRVLLSLALSVSAIVLTGLVLNAVRIALTGHALILALLVVTASACLVAAARSDSTLHTGAPSLSKAVRSPWLLSTTLLLAVFGVLLALLARPLPDPSYAGYTQLSGLRAGPNVRVAVTSAEHRRTSYYLQASAASGLAVFRAFTLAPEQRWSSSIHIGAPLEQTVRIRLYRATAPASVYREVVLRA
jgi:uncharacterized membrane protein